MKNYYTYYFIFILMISCGKKEVKKDPLKISTPNTEAIIKKAENKVEELPELIFTVQIAALKNRNATIGNLENIQISKEGILTKYRLGKFTTYREARVYRTSLLNKYPDAFVQALKKGEPLSIHKALSN